MRDVNCDFDWILGLVVRGGRARARGWERALGCPGAQPSSTRYIWDMAAVVRECNLALPGMSWIWQPLSGSAT